MCPVRRLLTNLEECRKMMLNAGKRTIALVGGTAMLLAASSSVSLAGGYGDTAGTVKADAKAARGEERADAKEARAKEKADIKAARAKEKADAKEARAEEKAARAK